MNSQKTTAIPFSIYKFLDKAKSRPGMYIGSNNIKDLDMFLNGYFMAVSENNIKEELPNFYFFHSFVARKYKGGSSVTGWCNIIYEESDNDNEKAMSMFFKLIKEFEQCKPIEILKVELTLENVKYYSKICNPSPISEKLHELYLVNYGEYIGCTAYFGSEGYWINHHYAGMGYSSIQEAQSALKELFGEIGFWSHYKDDYEILVRSFLEFNAYKHMEENFTYA